MAYLGNTPALNYISFAKQTFTIVNGQTSYTLDNSVANGLEILLYINDGSNDIYLIKDAPIPAGSSLQVLDGGAKFVVQSGDALKVVSDTASSLDVWVSTVDAIST